MPAPALNGTATYDEEIFQSLAIKHPIGLAVTLILDSSVERARVGYWRRVWVVASTRNATAFKEEQHPQTRRQ